MENWEIRSKSEDLFSTVFFQMIKFQNERIDGMDGIKSSIK